MHNEQERHDLVYKSNELIEGRYRLTAVAQKIAASTISRVNPTNTGEPLPNFRWSIAELSEISGINEYVLRNKLSSYTKELKAVVVELRKLGSNSYQQLGLFRVFTYNDDDKCLEIEFEDRLEAYIRDFSNNFTRYQLTQIQNLVSGHSVRIYEILRMAYNRAKVKRPDPTYECSLEVLKAMLGIKKSAYKVFANFRRKVLEVAQIELAGKSDIEFDFETLKRGRKIAIIRFHIRHAPIFEEGSELEEGQLLSNIPILDEGVRSVVLNSFPDMGERELAGLALYSKDTIMESLLAYYRVSASKENEITNPMNYFLKIVSECQKSYNSEQKKRHYKNTQEEIDDVSWQGDN